MQNANLIVVGRAEKVSFPSLGIKHIPSKIDTGADASSISCSRLKIVNSQLECVFFEKGSPFYTGIKTVFDMENVELTRVANSFGHRELRYKVKLPVQIKGRKINATFTLTDRSTKLYPVLIGRSLLKNKPVLIGRSLLKNKFLVDVSKGTPLYEEEYARLKRLKKEMKRIKKELQI
jgi:hypothetical protein